MECMITFYNQQKNEFQEALKKNNKLEFDDFASKDSTKISWNDSLKISCAKNINLAFSENEIRVGLYRPFFKNYLYFDKNFIQRPYLQPKLFPNSKLSNTLICITGTGNLGFSLLISNMMPDLCFVKTGNGGAQCFPLYYYEERQKTKLGLFDEGGNSEYIRRDGVSDFILERAKTMYGKTVNKEDIFYYVYGFLHSPEYRILFANDLKKMLPRLPLVEDVRDYWKFSKAGRALAALHINYETVPPAKEVVVLIDRVTKQSIEKGMAKKEMDIVNYRVEKMRFPKKDQKDTIIYNSQITINNIPAKAYQYVVNGKSAIEWIMERYAVTIHKESGIKNDPNDWAEEVGNPKYILDLLLSIINLSVQTVEIVEGLPKVKFE
jgi:predicted helicase